MKKPKSATCAWSVAFHIAGLKSDPREWVDAPQKPQRAQWKTCGFKIFKAFACPTSPPNITKPYKQVAWLHRKLSWAPGSEPTWCCTNTFKALDSLVNPRCVNQDQSKFNEAITRCGWPKKHLYIYVMWKSYEYRMKTMWKSSTPGVGLQKPCRPSATLLRGRHWIDCRSSSIHWWGLSCHRRAHSPCWDSREAQPLAVTWWFFPWLFSQNRTLKEACFAKLCNRAPTKWFHLKSYAVPYRPMVTLWQWDSLEVLSKHLSWRVVFLPRNLILLGRKKREKWTSSVGLLCFWSRSPWSSHQLWPISGLRQYAPAGRTTITHFTGNIKYDHILPMELYKYITALCLLLCSMCCIWGLLRHLAAEEQIPEEADEAMGHGLSHRLTVGAVRLTVRRHREPLRCRWPLLGHGPQRKDRKREFFGNCFDWSLKRAARQLWQFPNV